MKSNYTRRVSAWVRYQTSRLIVRKKNKKMPTTTLNSIIINYYVFVWNKIASLVSTFDRLIDTRDGCDSRIIIIIIKKCGFLNHYYYYHYSIFDFDIWRPQRKWIKVKRKILLLLGTKTLIIIDIGNFYSGVVSKKEKKLKIYHPTLLSAPPFSPLLELFSYFFEFLRHDDVFSIIGNRTKDAMRNRTNRDFFFSPTNKLISNSLLSSLSSSSSSTTTTTTTKCLFRNFFLNYVWIGTRTFAFRISDETIFSLSFTWWHSR